MNKAIAWFTSNHVAANLLMLFFVVGGIMTLLGIKVEVFPETSMDRISITVEYTGASPAEVEESIIRRIEEKIAGLAGIRRIDSVAREGMASISIEVMDGWDLQKLLDEVKAEVDRLTTLPEEAEKPVVREQTRRTQVLWVAVYGDAPEATLKHLAEKLQDDITNLPDVTLAELFGVRTGEIHVEVSEETLRRYGLTLAKVAQAIKQASLDLPAGSIKTKGAEILIRAKGRRYYAARHEDIPIITRNDGSVVTLGQIATLKEGFEDSDLYGRFQGKPAAVIQIYRVADQNALTVASTVKDFLKKAEKKLPDGVSIGFYGDRSTILKSRMELLGRNMLQGLILVIIILGLVLEIRLSFWVTLGIPVSFLIGLWFLPTVDISINMVSLFAFILVLGIVVDDAIVVGENIYKKREEGMPPLQAAIEGAQQVGGPVIFAVLTTVAAFAPMLSGTGMMGKLLKNIPWVVILVLTGSLLESLFILPAHLARSKADPKKETLKKRLFENNLKFLVEKPYRRFLELGLRWRYATLAAGLCSLLLVAGTFTSGILKFTLMPKVESDVIQAHVKMVAGTPVARTTEVVQNLERACMAALAEEDAKRAKGAPPLLDHTVSLVGIEINSGGPHSGSPETGGHVATIYAQLLEGEKRDRTAEQLTNLWRKKAGPVHDAQYITFQSEIFSAGNAVEVHLSHPDENILTRAVKELKEGLTGIPGVFDLADSFLPGKDELQIGLKATGRALGLTLSEVSAQVRHAFYGAEALRVQRGKDEVKVLVRYPDSQRHSLDNIERMRIRTPDGSEVPFGQVAEVTRSQGYSVIERAQRRKVIKVTADVDESVNNANEVRAHMTAKLLPPLARKYPELRFEMEGAAREQRESFQDLGKGFVVALFGIYILLAIPFKSFTQPFIVMMAIPFGIVGAMLGHLIMGYNISMLSLFGIVGLSGVVVNDSLLLIYTVNKLREEGHDAFEAVSLAGRQRFRPIMLTSLTTFAGLIPIITEKSLQAQFLIPMALSLGFGVLFATAITLMLIPCGYLALEDFHRACEAARGLLHRRKTHGG